MCRANRGQHCQHANIEGDPIEARSSNSTAKVEKWVESVEKIRSTSFLPEPLDDHSAGSDDNDLDQIELASTSTGGHVPPKQFGCLIKTLMKLGAPTSARCNITNAEFGIHPAHVLHRALPERHYPRLERAWGLDKHGAEFNIHSRRNLFLLDHSIHDSYLCATWALLPEREILEHIHNNWNQPDVLYNTYYKDVKLWTYRFFATKKRYLRFLPWVSPYIEGEPEVAPEVRRWPYTDMTIVSHVSPLFIIAEMGSKLTHEKHMNVWVNNVPEHLEEVAGEFRIVSHLAKDWLGSWVPPLRYTRIPSKLLTPSELAEQEGCITAESE
ncbi:hypothetical protein NP233_g8761 [Leucocoprinus birnbaumii]|uniref:HNH nuclease domain-containing protein n=1 Tax=Leucocoprinus birnbaumii TaxID=56174 RepID=A0AAD5VLS2_9AGAR|nr:hypothetical protein NP233_g8761 [Leucocoprinus birnbaumii]